MIFSLDHGDKKDLENTRNFARYIKKAIN